MPFFFFFLLLEISSSLAGVESSTFAVPEEDWFGISFTCVGGGSEASPPPVLAGVSSFGSAGWSGFNSVVSFAVAAGCAPGAGGVPKGLGLGLGSTGGGTFAG